MKFFVNKEAPVYSISILKVTSNPYILILFVKQKYYSQIKWAQKNFLMKNYYP